MLLHIKGFYSMAFDNKTNAFIVDYLAKNNEKYYKRVVIACILKTAKEVNEKHKPIYISKVKEK